MGVLSELIKKSAGAADAMSPAPRAGGNYKTPVSYPTGPQSLIDVVAPTGTPEVVPQVVPPSGWSPIPDADYFPEPPMPVSAYPQNPNRLPQSVREMEIRELIRQQRRDMRSQSVPPEPARFRDRAFEAMGRAPQ